MCASRVSLVPGTAKAHFSSVWKTRPHQLITTKLVRTEQGIAPRLTPPIGRPDSPSEADARTQTISLRETRPGHAVLSPAVHCCTCP